MENEVGTMYNLNMEESAGGSSYVSWAKGNTCITSVHKAQCWVLFSLCSRLNLSGVVYTTPLTPAFLTTSSTQQDIMAARYVSLNLTSHQCCISDLKGLMTNNQPELNEKTKQK